MYSMDNILVAKLTVQLEHFAIIGGSFTLFINLCTQVDMNPLWPQFEQTPRLDKKILMPELVSHFFLPTINAVTTFIFYM